MSAISALIRPDRYPLSSRYDPRWVIALEMGPHPLWQLEDILPALALEPGSRVLDLGCGRGATSVFLARECGVTVTACDLWVSVEELEGVVREAGVERSVTDAAWAETDELRVAERSNPQIKSYVRPEEPPRKESMPCSAVTISVGT